jgi:hypothetical protein
MRCIDDKAQGFGGTLKRAAHWGGRGFGHGIAGGADQEGGRMRLAGVHAGGKGVQTVDTVDKALFDKEIKRTVGHGGLVAETIFGQPLQHIICAKGVVGFEQDLQHAAAHGRQAHTFGGGQGIGAGQHITGAARVIVPRKGKVGRGTGGAGGIMRGAVR